MIHGLVVSSGKYANLFFTINIECTHILLYIHQCGTTFYNVYNIECIVITYSQFLTI